MAVQFHQPGIVDSLSLAVAEGVNSESWASANATAVLAGDRVE